MSHPVGLTFYYVLLLLLLGISLSLCLFLSLSLPPSPPSNPTSQPENAVQLLFMIETTLCYRQLSLCARANTQLQTIYLMQPVSFGV